MITQLTRLNIDEFCADVARVWLYLVDQFPKQITLYVDDIVGPDHEDEFGLKTDRYLRALSAIAWLESEGFLRFSQQVKQESFDECVLTAKGLNTLIVRTSPEGERLCDQLHAALETPSILPSLVLKAIELA
jgi:hypothetical protein